MVEDEKTVDTNQTAVAGNEEKPTTEAQAYVEGDIVAELIQVRKERDNYKNGLLVSKGKKNIEEFSDDEKESIQDVITRTVAEQIAATRNQDLDKKEQALIEKLAKENRELKLAQRNRAQTSNISTGSKTDTTNTSKPSEFTAEQLAYFAKVEKQTGVKIDPNKVIENLKKR